VSVKFQFLQKTPFKAPRSGADHLFTNFESYFNHPCAQIKLLTMTVPN